MSDLHETFGRVRQQRMRNAIEQGKSALLWFGLVISSALLLWAFEIFYEIYRMRGEG